MARLRLEHITRKFGSVVAVNDLSLEVREGEFLVIVGPSGCGKSTVLRIVAGLEDVTEGRIYIDGRLVNGIPAGERNIAMVFESPVHALYPNMTVYDNLAFGLRLRAARRPASSDEARPPAGADSPAPGAPREAREGAIRSRVEKYIGRVGLGNLLRRKPGQLSAGHRQTVALERAMVREPLLYLMDDPLSQLDAHLRLSAIAELRRLHRELRATVLYVTHDQNDAMSLGDHIAVMDAGRLQQIGPPQAIYDHPANIFVAGFIGSPSMNLIPATIEEKDGQALAVAGEFRVPVPAHLTQRLGDLGNFTLGLRPESIHDARFRHDGELAVIQGAQVELREYNGSDVFMHVKVGDQPLVARMDERTTARPGQTMDLAVDTSNVHAFHPVHGDALF